MNKALWFLLFFAVTFAGDRAIGYLLKQRMESSQFRYSRMYTGRAAADILLVGNSRGLPFYQPAIEEATQKSTFNLSYNGAPAYLLDALACDYVDKYPGTKTALIDITLCDRPNKALLSGFGAYLPYSPRLSQLFKDTIPYEYWAAQVSHIYRFNSEVFHRTIYHQNKTDKDWLVTHTISEEAAKDPAAKPYPLELHPNLIDALAHTVKTLQSKGIKTQLVIGPYAPGYAEKVYNLTELKQAVEAKTGLQVHDYRALLTDYRDFSDYMHPNKSGSLKYIEAMKADGLFE